MSDQSSEGSRRGRLSRQVLTQTVNASEKTGLAPCPIWRKTWKNARSQCLSLFSRPIANTVGPSRTGDRHKGGPSRRGTGTKAANQTFSGGYARPAALEPVPVSRPGLRHGATWALCAVINGSCRIATVNGGHSTSWRTWRPPVFGRGLCLRWSSLVVLP
jgi:hypothetical protein